MCTCVQFCAGVYMFAFVGVKNISIYVSLLVCVNV
jgi:hypothetical protein